MKLSRKQQLDLSTIKHFIPANTKFGPITAHDIEAYFAWSDRGIGGEAIKREAMQTNTGIAALYWGKNRRDLQVKAYIEDWGEYITAVDFAEEPEFLAEWLSRVMGKPAIYIMWRLFNRPGPLDDTDNRILEPLTRLSSCKVGIEKEVLA